MHRSQQSQASKPPDHAATTDAVVPVVGVLAMQGAFAEHVRALEACGAATREVRTAAELATVDGLVIPGGESTAIRKGLDRAGLLDPLRERLEGGMPAFGTCAGLIVLAHSAPDGAPPTYGLLDVDVERNGFGRQTQSAELQVELERDAGGSTAGTDSSCASGQPTSMRGVFIRAPRVTRVGDDVRVVGRIRPTETVSAAAAWADEPVVVEQGNLLGATFHPELTSDLDLHERFVARVRAHAGATAGTDAAAV